MQHPGVPDLLQNQLVLEVQLLLQKRALQVSTAPFLLGHMTKRSAATVTFWLLERRQTMKKGSAFSIVVINFPRDVCETQTTFLQDSRPPNAFSSFFYFRSQT